MLRDDRLGLRERAAVVVYAAAWIAVTGAVVGFVLGLLGGGGDDTVGVRPLHQTRLAVAAKRSGCELRVARVHQPLNPPVDGASGVRPAAPGVYTKPLRTAALTAAVRHGIVVIQFRPGLDDEPVQELEQLQAAVPRGTIVVPNATGMSFALAVTAYHRLLGCPRWTSGALDAVQLFRGRFLGSGPEA
jgi:hypothetical protein